MDGRNIHPEEERSEGGEDDREKSKREREGTAEEKSYNLSCSIIVPISSSSSSILFVAAPPLFLFILSPSFSPTTWHNRLLSEGRGSIIHLGGSREAEEATSQPPLLEIYHRVRRGRDKKDEDGEGEGEPFAA